MSNVADIKPWFKEDIARALASIYFSSMQTQKHDKTNTEYHNGFAVALASVALAAGINPETFLSPEDVQQIKQKC